MNFFVSVRISFIVAVFCLLSGTVCAQQNHFIYLQSEESKPFYIKLNNKLISSSEAGYLILPEMTDGEYKLTVGFPKNQAPEVSYTITVNQKNEGYLLKNLADRGMVLFNMHTLNILEGAVPNANTTVSTSKIVDDPFSTMLASAVKDPTLLEVKTITEVPITKPKQEVKSEEPVQAKKESASVEKKPLQETVSATAPTEIPKPNQSKPVPDTIFMSDTVYAKGNEAIKKILQEKTGNSDVTYAVKTATGMDTIRVEMAANQSSQKEEAHYSANANTERKDSSILKPISVYKENADSIEYTITPTVWPKDTTKEELPIQEIKTVQEVKSEKKNETQVLADSVIIESKSAALEQKPEPRILDADKILEANNKADAKNSKENKEAKPTKKDELIVLPQRVTESSVNSDCKEFATDQDFLKLRRRMASQTNEDNMVREAKKYFKLKCFSTDQLKDLSFLFRSDQGKYIFLDAAYPFTSDSNRFGELQTLFQESYYINRFRALIGK